MFQMSQFRTLSVELQFNRKCRKRGAGHHQVLCKKESENSADSEADCNRLITATVKGKKQVLLQTTAAYAFGPDESKEIPIHIFIRWRQSEKLYLRRPKEKATSGCRESVNYEY